MQPHRTVQVFLAVFLAATLACRAQSAPPDERGLWQLWVASTNAISDHAMVVAACKEFIAKSPQDPFVVVARGLEAWHLLESGDTNTAAALFEAMAAVPENAAPLQAAGAEMARCWLTRIDREQVRQALKKLYFRDIEFPERLDAITTLKATRPPPLTDRWGNAWVYRLESPVKGMREQQYLLESPRLGPWSDLSKALALPYAGGITLVPVKPAPVSNDIYEFASPSQKGILLQAGSGKDGVMLACLGVNLIVMSNGSHWRVSLKPR